jgi:hypothetical protein
MRGIRHIEKHAGCRGTATCDIFTCRFFLSTGLFVPAQHWVTSWLLS